MEERGEWAGGDLEDADVLGVDQEHLRLDVPLAECLAKGIRPPPPRDRLLPPPNPPSGGGGGFDSREVGGSDSPPPPQPL